MAKWVRFGKKREKSGKLSHAVVMRKTFARPTAPNLNSNFESENWEKGQES